MVTNVLCSRSIARSHSIDALEDATDSLSTGSQLPYKLQMDNSRSLYPAPR